MKEFFPLSQLSSCAKVGAVHKVQHDKAVYHRQQIDLLSSSIQVSRLSLQCSSVTKARIGYSPRRDLIIL